MAKINISLDDELLAKIDEMAKAYYTNRSAYIAMTMAQIIKQQEKVMEIVTQTISSAKDDAEASKETQNKK